MAGSLFRCCAFAGAIALTIGCEKRSPVSDAGSRPEDVAPVSVVPSTSPDGASPKPSEGGAAAVAAARALLEDLRAERFAAAVARFDATMAKVLPEPKLRATWAQIAGPAGALKSIGASKSKALRGHEVVETELAFEKGALVATVSIDGAGRVAGLFFRPILGGTPSDSPPPYAKPKKTESVEVVVGAAPWALGGTLTLPKPRKGRVPAVVLVHGSGPHDRDETVGAHKPFRDLAFGLAARGIATLRYEKRTKAHGPALAANKALTVREEVIEDAVAALQLLAERPEVDASRLFLLGHSLGGCLAPRIAAEAPELAGVIIAAGTPRPLEDVIVGQLEYLSKQGGRIPPEAKKTIAAAKAAARRVKSRKLRPDTPAAELPLGVPAPYWLDLRSHPPSRYVKELRGPVLLLQGGRDYQITMRDLDAWRRLLPESVLVLSRVYPKASHTFVEGEGKPSPEDYAKAGFLAESVVADIAAFVYGSQRRR